MFSQISVWLLVISIALLWSKNYKEKIIWPVGISFVLGYVTGCLDLMGIVLIMAYAFLVIYYQAAVFDRRNTKFHEWFCNKVINLSNVHSFKLENKEEKIIIGFWIIIFTIFMMAHKIWGVNNVLVYPKIKLENSATFNFYLNFDKAIAGLILLGSSGVVLTNFENFKKNIKFIFIAYVIVSVIILPIALATGFVKFSPGVHMYIMPIWLMHNLFITAICEEAFFRVFIFEYLEMAFSEIDFNEKFIVKHFTKYLEKIQLNIKDAIYILISSVFFALCHIPVGGVFAFLCFFAGLAYGYLYVRTKMIETSIALHFLLNLTHILLFTYPMQQI